MNDIVRWGVLSTADIGVRKVIPAMQRSELCEMTGIASRSEDKARQVATKLGIPKTFESYEGLLADGEIEAVYIPLPNHLHVDWAIAALEAGKHVLVEKPIGLNSEEGQRLVEAGQRFPNLKLMEAFMYRHHPQWVRAAELSHSGEIGELRTVQSFFSYHNVDADDIRNQPEYGGGGLFDIGCYNVSLSRFLTGSEPNRVLGLIERDPTFGTDRIASGILDFGTVTSTFTCSTQLVPYQRVNIFGTIGRIEIEIPFNAPPDRPCRLWVQRGSETVEITVPTADQYTVQGDLFSRAILDNTPVPTPIEDAVGNMRVLERLFQSADGGGWA